MALSAVGMEAIVYLVGSATHIHAKVYFSHQIKEGVSLWLLNLLEIVVKFSSTHILTI